MSPAIAGRSEVNLSGRGLTLARSVWMVLVALALGLYLFSIPLKFAYYKIVCSGAACPSDQIGPAQVEQLRQAGLALGFYAGYMTALTAIRVLVFSVVAAIIFWRKSDNWMGIFAALALVLLGITFNSGAFAPVGKQYPALQFLGLFLTFLGQTGFNIFPFLFPDGRFVPRWMVLLVPLVVVREALNAFRPDLLGNDWLFLVELASGIFALIYRYRRVSNSVQRQQTKWVVFGVGIAASGIVGLILYSNTAWPGGNPPEIVSVLLLVTAFHLFIVLIPLSIGLAILRSRLWDIDVLIRRTLIYGLLTALLALVYLSAVIALETFFAALTGSARSELVTVLSTLAIAALFVPLRRRVQAFIDRRFYRRKYDAARTLAQFGTGLRDEVDLDNLSAHLLTAVDETMQPASVGLWLRGKDEPSWKDGGR
jgi:hypothetical protein